MLRALFVALLLFSAVTMSQSPDALVTAAELDGAVADITAAIDPDDPQRARLLDMYIDTGSALAARAQFLAALETYAQARASAVKQATDIEAGLAERDVVSDGPSASASLAELEQQVLVSKADLAAAKSNLDEARNSINGMPERAVQVRSK
jgi:hypothetical protein